MKARERKMLEALFAAEIDGRLPKQFASTNLQIFKLEAQGLAMRSERKLGGRFPMVIKGWELTERGRLIYCMSCKEIPDDEGHG